VNNTTDASINLADLATSGNRGIGEGCYENLKKIQRWQERT